MLYDFFWLQLFSKSVACGLSLYKDHIEGLYDADATIDFTQRINDIFDLMNSRRPVEAIRMKNKQDKLKVKSLKIPLLHSSSWLFIQCVCMYVWVSEIFELAFFLL